MILFEVKPLFFQSAKNSDLLLGHLKFFKMILWALRWKKPMMLPDYDPIELFSFIIGLVNGNKMK